MPPVVRCPACGGTALEPAELSGPGMVVGVTRVHTSAARQAPWIALLVDADDGVRLVGLGTGPLSVGDRVELAGDEDGVAVFAPAGR